MGRMGAMQLSHPPDINCNRKKVLVHLAVLLFISVCNKRPVDNNVFSAYSAACRRKRNSFLFI
jgi:hypothetical protein